MAIFTITRYVSEHGASVINQTEKGNLTLTGTVTQAEDQIHYVRVAGSVRPQPKDISGLFLGVPCVIILDEETAQEVEQAVESYFAETTNPGVSITFEGTLKKATPSNDPNQPPRIILNQTRKKDGDRLTFLSVEAPVEILDEEDVDAELEAAAAAAYQRSQELAQQREVSRSNKLAALAIKPAAKSKAKATR